MQQEDTMENPHYELFFEKQLDNASTKLNKPRINFKQRTKVSENEGVNFSNIDFINNDGVDR